jgi:hypothetical protein
MVYYVVIQYQYIASTIFKVIKFARFSRFVSGCSLFHMKRTSFESKRTLESLFSGELHPCCWYIHSAHFLEAEKKRLSIDLTNPMPGCVSFFLWLSVEMEMDDALATICFSLQLDEQNFTGMEEIQLLSDHPNPEPSLPPLPTVGQHRNKKSNFFIYGKIIIKPFMFQYLLF